MTLAENSWELQNTMFDEHNTVIAAPGQEGSPTVAYTMAQVFTEEGAAGVKIEALRLQGSYGEAQSGMKIRIDSELPEEWWTTFKSSMVTVVAENWDELGMASVVQEEVVTKANPDGEEGEVEPQTQQVVPASSVQICTVDSRDFAEKLRFDQNRRRIDPTMLHERAA